jgi:prepilin peptidase CpaA
MLMDIALATPVCARYDARCDGRHSSANGWIVIAHPQVDSFAKRIREDEADYVDGRKIEAQVNPPIAEGMLAIALVTGWTDLRSRRIPNWLTVPSFALRLASNTLCYRWGGLKASLFGVLVGLGLLLPFFLIRSLGAGDWKLAGALGAFTGPGLLIDLLVLSIFVAGVMALMLIICKGRIRETLRNMGHILISLLKFQLPGHRVSLDNPQSLKLPYGMALALSVLLYGAARWPARVLIFGILAGILLIGLMESLNSGP